MTAPALVMVARGSSDPMVAQVTHQLVSGLAKMRPEMSVHGAFLQSSPPTAGQVIDQLAAANVTEVVLVPLELSHAVECDPAMAELLHKARTNYPDLRFTLSRPVGPEISLLTILDQRLRTSLSQARCLELDGLVLSAACTGDVRGSALLARRARQWSTHHRLPCLTAVADDSGPSVAQAIMGLRAQGRRHIAVGSFFLSADEAYHAQSDLAYRYGAVSVSDPIGACREVLDLVLARYAFAAMDLLDFGQEEFESPTRHLSVVSA
ncbi:sirohydrochlorin chelatase [Propionicimonas sp.]|uniref:sirohydrochlorin chelatase n=1 Tax=Propionicimonas sp. TaxID=1955623 RepID=UPI0039E70F60